MQLNKVVRKAEQKDLAVRAALLKVLGDYGIKVINPDRPKSIATGWYGYDVVVDDNEMHIVIDSNPTGYNLLVAHNNVIGLKVKFKIDDCMETFTESLEKKALLMDMIKIRFGKTSGRRLYGI